MVTPPDKEGAPVEALTREGGIILASENGEQAHLCRRRRARRRRRRQPQPRNATDPRHPRGDALEPHKTSPPRTAKPRVWGRARHLSTSTSLRTSRWRSTNPGASNRLRRSLRGSPRRPRICETTRRALHAAGHASEHSPGTCLAAQVHFVVGDAGPRALVVRSGVALTGPGSAPGLYEWSAGASTFVSHSPKEHRRTNRNSASRAAWSRTPISTDGSRVVWTSREDLSTRGGHLYLRDTASGKTLQLDAAQGVAEPSKGSALFQGADPNDSRIFFTDRQRLTADSTAEAGQGVGKPDLYVCDVVEVEGELACRLQDLTVDAQRREHAAVQGLLLGAAQTVPPGSMSSPRACWRANEAARGTPRPDRTTSTSCTTTAAAGRRRSSPRSRRRRQPRVGRQHERGPRVLTAQRVAERPLSRVHERGQPDRLRQRRREPRSERCAGQEVYLYDSATASLTMRVVQPDRSAPGRRAGPHRIRRRARAARRPQGRTGREHWLAGNIPGWTAQSLNSALFQPRYLR